MPAGRFAPSVGAPESQSMNTQDAKRVLETALICAQAPLSLRDMRVLFDDQVGADTLRALLDELTRDWEDRGVELVAHLPVSIRCGGARSSDQDKRCRDRQNQSPCS